MACKTNTDSMVIWIDRSDAFKTHLSSTIKVLRETVTLETFTDNESALEAMSSVVNSGRIEREDDNKQTIVCVITNMQRNHPRSGLELLKAMKNIFPANNQSSSFPPTIVYSRSAADNPSLIDDCNAAGAMQVLSNNVTEIRRIINECVQAASYVNILGNPVNEQIVKLSNVLLEYHSLFHSHCLDPLPDKYGGKLSHQHAQKLIQLEWRLLYKVLLDDILKKFASRCASNKHYISGGLAINRCLNSYGFPSILTCDCDFRFKSKEHIEEHANQMKAVLEKHKRTVRVSMARLGLTCGDPEVSTDNCGCRVYFPLRSSDSSASSSTSATLSHYDFMWKVFDVSHNWTHDPADLTKKDGVNYVGEREILNELSINYGAHKEKRRRLRLKLMNFVLR